MYTHYTWLNFSKKMPEFVQMAVLRATLRYFESPFFKNFRHQRNQEEYVTIPKEL